MVPRRQATCGERSLAVRSMHGLPVFFLELYGNQVILSKPELSERGSVQHWVKQEVLGGAKLGLAFKSVPVSALEGAKITASRIAASPLQ